MGRCMVLGVFFSLTLFLFYWHMFDVCVTVLKQGQCHGNLVVPCVLALFRKIFGMAAMLCYAVSLSTVLWNIDRLDAVLQVQDEIHELQDFKHQIDHLNAHELTDEDSGVSIIQAVEKALTKQKALVARFFNNAFGESVPTSAFETLAADLEEALDPNRGNFGDFRGFRPRRAYNNLTDEDRVEMGMRSS